jgi:hypothetical protein
MISKELKLTLAELVRENKKVLFSTFGPTVTKRLKDQTWNEIREHLCSLGSVIPDVKTLRDVEWYNLKKAVLKRYNDSLKTGASGSKLTQVDEVVMDVVDRESVNVRALNIPDMDLTFNSFSSVSANHHSSVQRDEETEPEFLVPGFRNQTGLRHHSGFNSG